MERYSLARLNRIATSPRHWRTRTRRLFLIGLPIALPVWLVGLAVLTTANLAMIAARSLTGFRPSPERYGSDYYGYGYKPERTGGSIAAPSPARRRAGRRPF